MELNSDVGCSIQLLYLLHRWNKDTTHAGSRYLCCVSSLPTPAAESCMCRVHTVSTSSHPLHHANPSLGTPLCKYLLPNPNPALDLIAINYPSHVNSTSSAYYPRLWRGCCSNPCFSTYRSLLWVVTLSFQKMRTAHIVPSPAIPVFLRPLPTLVLKILFLRG